MLSILISTAAAMIATSAPAPIGRTILVDGVPTVRVSYADLDLHSAGGRARMARRIRSAADKLCADAYYETSITEPLRNDCYLAALASGATQVARIAGR